MREQNKSKRWRNRMPYSQALTIEQAFAEIKGGPSYLLRGTANFAKRAAQHAKTSRMVQALLRRLP